MVRRSKGEGGVHKRKDGRWCATLDLGVIDSKRRRKDVYGKTRKEAVDKLKALQATANSTQDYGGMTVAAFLDYWLDQCKSRINPYVHLNYTRNSNNHLKPAFGSVALSALTARHIQVLVNDLATKRSPYTVRNIRAIIRRALNQAVRWGYVAKNVAALVEIPPIQHNPIVPLTHEQATAFLHAISGHRLEALYRLALGLGLRRGEVCGLRWQDVDLERGELRVTGALVRFGGVTQRHNTKTQTSRRTLQMPQQMIAILAAHQARQEQEQAVAGKQWHDSGYVFTTELGTPVDLDNVAKRLFKRFLQQVGLPATIRFHDLRHSCASFLIAEGVHLAVIKDILGHSDIGVTANIYGHILPTTQRSALESLSAIMQQGKP